jgi:hypothetical protein
VPADIVIPVAFFFLVGYIVWVWVSATQRKQRLRLMTEFHTRLLDKLGSVKDFGEFLQTDAGGRFMKDLAAEPAAGTHDRILRAAQVGIVLIFLGLGLLVLGFFWSPDAPESARQSFGAFGTISLSLGIGFVVSAAASYRLAGTLGLLNRPAETSSIPAPSRG